MVYSTDYYNVVDLSKLDDAIFWTSWLKTNIRSQLLQLRAVQACSALAKLTDPKTISKIEIILCILDSEWVPRNYLILYERMYLSTLDLNYKNIKNIYSIFTDGLLELQFMPVIIVDFNLLFDYSAKMILYFTRSAYDKLWFVRVHDRVGRKIHGDLATSYMESVYRPYYMVDIDFGLTYCMSINWNNSQLTKASSMLILKYWSILGRTSVPHFQHWNFNF